MTAIAIKVEQLSKRYQLGSKSLDLRTTITQKLHQLLRRKAAKTEDFWALKDISFQVNQGEILGVIGKNGAGKSTLLKILSRITEPSHGRIEVEGRVASLLEVGTGFHPELTGRENIFLNGAILGMPKKEIKRQFDEIVDFSGVEKFIDTPVKHFSSGMYVRLAFSVAAHLRQEVLLIDEVLSVGDAEFRKKCLNKMDSVAGDGRTIIFVSHNLGAIKQLCTKGILLEEGKIAYSGDISKVIDTYLATAENGQSGFVSWPLDTAPGNKPFKLLSVCLKDAQEQMQGNFAANEGITVEINYLLLEKVRGLRLTFPSDLFNNRTYRVILGAGIPKQQNFLIKTQVLVFSIARTEQFNANANNIWPGMINPICKWEL